MGNTAVMTASAADSRSHEPRMRKDVARNRALLLEAADSLLASRGLDMTLHELADAAGLGVGTVYRHFADKEVLLDALVEQRFLATRDLLLAAEQVEDPIRSLRQGVLDVCAYLTKDRAMLQAVVSNAERHQDLAERTLQPIAARMVERAMATGRLRADFDALDVPLIFLLSGGLAANAGTERPDLWRRYVEALLDGFMTHDADRVGSAVSAPNNVDVRSIIAASF